MMASPATVLSTSRYCRTACPNAEAVAPSSTKTVENPATNNRAANEARRRTRRLAFLHLIERRAGKNDR